MQDKKLLRILVVLLYYISDRMFNPLFTTNCFDELFVCEWAFFAKDNDNGNFHYNIITCKLYRKKTLCPNRTKPTYRSTPNYNVAVTSEQVSIVSCHLFSCPAFLVLHFHAAWFWWSVIFTSCIFSRPVPRISNSLSDDVVSAASLSPSRWLYTVNHKKRDILFLTITLANLNRFL